MTSKQSQKNYFSPTQEKHKYHSCVNQKKSLTQLISNISLPEPVQRSITIKTTLKANSIFQSLLKLEDCFKSVFCKLFQNFFKNFLKFSFSTKQKASCKTVDKEN